MQNEKIQPQEKCATVAAKGKEKEGDCGGEEGGVEKYRQAYSSTGTETYSFTSLQGQKKN